VPDLLPADVRFVPSPYHRSREGRAIEVVVLHYTSTATLAATLEIFQGSDRRVSAHYVIDRDGSLVQMVPLTLAAHHAGVSEMPGLGEGVNLFSVGIELVNWGLLEPEPAGPPGRFLSSTGARYEGPAPVRAADRQGRPRAWEPFAVPQVAALGRLLLALLAAVPTLRAVTGHEDVARPVGRKIDPGPAFDWTGLRTVLRGAFEGHVGPLPPTAP
jgi:N-acetylmuramoyl-L-alanine amidase